MSFLSAAFLVALPLAAAPLVLHLLDRRRQVTIDWGAMQFLEQASTERTSRRRLKQWLLLAMRVLSILLLVLALARPLLPQGSLGDRGRVETVLVVDNSLSMQAAAGDRTRHQAAQAELADRLAAAGRDARIVTTAPYPVWVDEASRGTIAPTEASGDLLAALLAAVRIEPDPLVATREIVVLTDGQARDWRLADEAGWARFRETLAAAPLPTTVDWASPEPSAEQPVGNAAIEAVTIGTGVVGRGQPVRIVARVRNFGSQPLPASSLVWTIGGEPAGESDTPAIDPGQSADIVWDQTFAEPGVLRIAADWQQPDPLPADNAAAAIVEVVDEVPIVLVEESFDRAEIQQDAYLVRAALGTIADERDTAPSVAPPSDAARAIYVPTLVTPSELGSIDLTEQRVVVIPNLTALDRATIGRLQRFVIDGGGLWIAAGPRTDTDRFNADLFADGGGLSPVALGRIVAAGPTRTWIDPFRSGHPANAQLADDSRLDLRSASIRRRFALAGGSDPSVLLMLNDGEPLAVGNYLGRGRVIVQAVPLRLQWSDLPRTQAFVVMVRDWIAYLAQPRATQFNLSPGQPIRLVRNGGDRAPAAILTPPGGESVEVTPLERAGGVEYASSRTRMPGAYTLEVGLTEPPLPFQVAREADESDLTPLDADGVARVASLLTPPEQAAVAEGPSGRSGQSDPIWPLLLLGLILLMTGELVLSGLLATDRFGTGGLPDHTDLDDSLGIPLSTVAPRERSPIGEGSPIGKRSPVGEGSRTGEEVLQ